MALKLEAGLENLQTFADRRRSSGKPLKESECASIVRGILQALKYLHDDKNLIHRDVQPQNVLLFDYDDLSQVKLIDFWLATEFSWTISDFERCGTPLYMPPE